MDLESIFSLMRDNPAETALLVGGIVALLVVLTYKSNEDGLGYKFMVLVGLIAGVMMVCLAMNSFADWTMFLSLLVSLLGFTLVIRPFRNVNFSIIIAILVMVSAYIMLESLGGTMLEVLSEGIPRIIAAVVIGGLVYSILHFVESVVKLVGKILNWWPLLLILAFVCIIESLLMIYGEGSVYDYIEEYVLK